MQEKKFLFSEGILYKKVKKKLKRIKKKEKLKTVLQYLKGNLYSMTQKLQIDFSELNWIYLIG